MGFWKAFDDAIAASPVGWFFRLEGSGHLKAWPDTRFSVEVRAGISTFMTMCYVIAANASILAETGGPCVKGHIGDTDYFQTDEFKQCVFVVKKDMVTATAVVGCLGSFFMGLLTNLPIAIAPGMGLNAYFAYQVVGVNGSGSVSYELALLAVFIEGFIFIALSLLGLRQWLAQIIPSSIKIACGAGIGLFLTLVGLGYEAGIGAVTGSPATPLTIAGCLPQYRDSYGMCTSHTMQSPTLWIGFMCGVVLTAFLMMYRVKSAMVIGILVVSAFSWPRNSDFTYFPHTTDGDARFGFFKQVVAFHPITKTLNAIQWDVHSMPKELAMVIFTLLYVDILDCTGTLYSMARFSGAVNPETGDFDRSTIAYSVDAAAISIGALLGTSPAVAYIESGAGIVEGGRTGLTSMVTGICFFISIFFAPIFASIPPWATGGALIMVGCMMMRGTLAINWRYPGDAIPAFVTLVFIPFSYSIAYGLIAGVLVYTTLNVSAWILKKVSGGKIVPVDEDVKEYWSYKTEMNSNPAWIVRLVSGEKRWWRKGEKQGMAMQDEDRFELQRPGVSPGPSEQAASMGMGKEQTTVYETESRYEEAISHRSDVMSEGKGSTQGGSLRYGRGSEAGMSDGKGSLRYTERRH
ncbi:permease family-domain-containing protein [Pyronema domesticum]|uniref:Similar to Putative xanthine/uracil permease C887.17 acc. no. O94300 n=1 Tax=Pyronema omphalodes (strain CBS 100304) TaxID=1076935 RepID=U4LS79_PYROM|nr:permease family-domain-containing protein [Pyronema domesticum]CCX34444.1 Similar to Putative xanthine/uracil permease C887.17; acc. no. O94300 [Pyronema omphalodes CBS 100304]